MGFATGSVLTSVYSLRFTLHGFNLVPSGPPWERTRHRYALATDAIRRKRRNPELCSYPVHPSSLILSPSLHLTRAEVTIAFVAAFVQAVIGHGIFYAQSSSWVWVQLGNRHRLM